MFFNIKKKHSHAELSGEQPVLFLFIFHLIPPAYILVYTKYRFLVSVHIKENSKTNIKIDEYNEKYDQLSERYQKLITRQDEFLKQKLTKQSKSKKLKAFIATLEKSTEKLEYWDDNIWMLLIENAVVRSNSSISFKFYNGLEV